MKKKSASTKRQPTRKTKLPDRPQLVIVVQGGVVQEALANLGLDISVIDFDDIKVDDANGDRLQAAENTLDNLRKRKDWRRVL